MEPEFEDFDYDVLFEATIPSGTSIGTQAVQLRNPDAPFFLTGLTMRIDGGSPAIIIRDALGRAINPDPMLLVNAGSFVQQTNLGSNTYLKWPKNSTLLIDLSELEAAGDVAVEILFRGFKRFRKGEAPCQ